uniref:Uncharacterized protein n=1 Tax=Cucumis melo TaxID=3656 RepID=A0A9I9DKT6_CUCME
MQLASSTKRSNAQGTHDQESTRQALCVRRAMRDARHVWPSEVHAACSYEVSTQ